MQFRTKKEEMRFQFPFCGKFEIMHEAEQGESSKYSMGQAQKCLEC